MRLPTITVASLAVLSAVLYTQAGAQALSYEELRVNVEAKIRGNGATNYAVSVVEAASTAQGQVVGTCERGTRKLVYLKANAAGPIVSQPSTATGASVPAAAKPKAPTVITECADGRVTTTGSCKPP